MELKAQNINCYTWTLDTACSIHVCQLTVSSLQWWEPKIYCPNLWTLQLFEVWTLQCQLPLRLSKEEGGVAVMSWLVIGAWTSWCSGMERGLENLCLVCGSVLCFLELDFLMRWIHKKCLWFCSKSSTEMWSYEPILMFSWQYKLII